MREKRDSEGSFDLFLKCATFFGDNLCDLRNGNSNQQ